MNNDKKILKIYKQRWKRLAKIEDQELRRMTKWQKLIQLDSLIRLGSGMRLDVKDDKEIGEIRQRWTLLKKKLK